MGITRATVAAAVVAGLVAPAHAGDLGLGVQLGHPTSVSIKTHVGHSLAVQGGIGTGVFRGVGLHVHGDLLWIPTLLSDGPKRRVPLYVGGGLRLWDHNYDPVSRYDNGRDLHVGLRIPVGVAIEMKDHPVDIFFEAGVVVDFVGASGCSAASPGSIYCRADSNIDVLFGAGARYWFGGTR